MEARSCLPVLLRKLVHTTGHDLDNVDFPGYDNSQRHGWDGWVDAGRATAWVPQGQSGWEFGTSQDPARKAEGDYRDCWRDWAQASKPHMTEHIFETSIAACIKEFSQWLKSPPERPFVVAADSKEEALAFLACLFQHDDILAYQRDWAAVFESSETLAMLAASSSPFIPIAGNDATQIKSRSPVRETALSCDLPTKRRPHHAEYRSSALGLRRVQERPCRHGNRRSACSRSTSQSVRPLAHHLEATAVPHAGCQTAALGRQYHDGTQFSASVSPRCMEC